MQPVAHVLQFPNGQMNFKIPNGRDIIWMLGWLELAKETLKQQLTQQAEQSIEIPPAEAVGTLLNGVKQ